MKAAISTKNKTEDVISTKLCYTLKDKKVADFIKVENGKMHCPICRNMVKNIKMHFETHNIARLCPKPDITHTATIAKSNDSLIPH